MVNRGCSFEMPDGLLCNAPALRGKALCYWHEPDASDAAQEARRVGGHHRRKAKSVATIYDFAGLRSIESAQRLLETGGHRDVGPGELDRPQPDPHQRPVWRRQAHRGRRS